MPERRRRWNSSRRASMLWRVAAAVARSCGTNCWAGYTCRRAFPPTNASQPTSPFQPIKVSCGPGVAQSDVQAIRRRRATDARSVQSTKAWSRVVWVGVHRGPPPWTVDGRSLSRKLGQIREGRARILRQGHSMQAACVWTALVECSAGVVAGVRSGLGHGNWAPAEDHATPGTS